MSSFRIQLLFVIVTCLVGSLLLLLPKIEAFVVVNPNAGVRPPSRLFLEDWVADMIDGELWR